MQKQALQTFPRSTKKKKRSGKEKKTGKKERHKPLLWLQRGVMMQQKDQVMQRRPDDWKEWGDEIESPIPNLWPRDKAIRTWPVTDASTAGLLAKSRTPTHTLSIEHKLPESLPRTACLYPTSKLPQTPTLNPGSCKTVLSHPETRPRGDWDIQRTVTNALGGTENTAGAAYR